MKIGIDATERSPLDFIGWGKNDKVVLPAWRIKDGKLAVWCKYCSLWHLHHDAGPDIKYFHDNQTRAFPPYGSSYLLRIVGDLTPKIKSLAKKQAKHIF